jgi:hypothetical protein
VSIPYGFDRAAVAARSQGPQLPQYACGSGSGLSSGVRPHYLVKAGSAAGTYVRVGSTNRRADAALIAELRFALFDDRLEVENPGLLPFGLTVADLPMGVSKLRNRVRWLNGLSFHNQGAFWALLSLLRGHLRSNTLGKKKRRGVTAALKVFDQMLITWILTS